MSQGQAPNRLKSHQSINHTRRDGVLTLGAISQGGQNAASSCAGSQAKDVGHARQEKQCRPLPGHRSGMRCLDSQPDAALQAPAWRPPVILPTVLLTCLCLHMTIKGNSDAGCGISVANLPQLNSVHHLKAYTLHLTSVCSSASAYLEKPGRSWEWQVLPGCAAGCIMFTESVLKELSCEDASGSAVKALTDKSDF